MPLRQPYDESQRRAAGFMQRENPYWLIMYGVWSRLYWATPAFDVPPHTILSAAEPDDLLRQMRQVELRYLPPPYQPPAAPPERG
jgi:hypothetical protein